MKRTVIIFTFLSFIAKIIAFGRELVLAYCYGTSMTSDVFILSMTLPVTFFGFISTGILSAFPPVYAGVRKARNQKEAVLLTNRVLHILLLFCLAMVTVYYIFSGPLIRLLASGFSEEAAGLAVSFTDISIWAVIFSCITAVFTAYLQMNGWMQVTAWVSVPLNAGIMLAVAAAFYTEQLWILPAGYVAASIAQAVYLLIFALHAGYRYQFGLGLNQKYVKNFFQSMAMLSAAGSIQQINVLIDRTLATQIAVGGLSVFEYGSRINDFIMGISIIPISTAIYPELVNHADHTELLKKKVKEGMLLFAGLMIPLTVIITEFCVPIVTIIYGRGAFDDASAVHTAEVVFYYGLGLLAFAFRELLAKIFYAASDLKTPMKNAAAGVLLNILLNFILSGRMGLAGLAFATSISAAVTVILLYWAAVIKFGKFGMKENVKSILIIGIATAGASVTAYIVYQNMFHAVSSVWICFGTACICFGAVYICILIKLGAVDLRNYMQKAKNKEK